MTDSDAKLPAFVKHTYAPETENTSQFLFEFDTDT